MKFWYLFKTYHPPSGAVFFGMHESDDANFGTPYSIDTYRGQGSKLIKAVRLLGGGAFITEALFRGSKEQCQQLLKNIRAKFVYDDPRCLNLPEPPSFQEIDIAKIQKNNKNNLGVFRPDLKWKGTKRKQPTREQLLKKYHIDPNNIPKGYTIKWCHNPKNGYKKLIVIKRKTSIGLPPGYVLGKPNTKWRQEQKERKLEKLNKRFGWQPDQLELPFN